MSTQRAQLQKELMRYKKEQIDSLIQASIPNRRLDHYTSTSNGLEIIIGQLLTQLEMQRGELLLFLFHVRVSAPWPELRSAINEYFGFPPSNPYASKEALIPYGEPNVDRDQIRNDLQKLFQRSSAGVYRHRALVVSGRRSIGRSHTKWLIHYVAKHENCSIILIDIAEKSLEDIISIISTEITIPFLNGERVDSTAQFTRQAKNFPDAVGAGVRKQPVNSYGEFPRWCLVFDHYDREGVEVEAKELVDGFVKYIANNPELNLWVIVLSHNNPGIFQSVPRVLQPSIDPLERAHLADYLVKVAEYNGELYTTVQLNQLCDTLLEGLNPPLVKLDEMNKLYERLLPYVE